MMHTLQLLAIEFSGKIGVGTFLTFGVVVAGVAIYLTNDRRGGDPNDLRVAYTTELARREEAEQRLKETAIELATWKAKTDITGLEERMTRRMDIFEKAAEKQTQILEGLVSAVTSLIEQKGHA